MYHTTFNKCVFEFSLKVWAREPGFLRGTRPGAAVGTVYCYYQYCCYCYDVKVEWRPMRSRPVCAAHSRHVTERVRPPRKGKKKKGRAGWQGAEVRPGTAGEASTTSHNTFSPTEGMGEGRGGGRGTRCTIVSFCKSTLLHKSCSTTARRNRGMSYARETNKSPRAIHTSVFGAFECVQFWELPYLV